MNIWFVEYSKSSRPEVIRDLFESFIRSLMTMDLKTIN